eukprot:jgi/Mesvir1/15975/Mv08284-RA.1
MAILGRTARFSLFLLGIVASVSWIGYLFVQLCLAVGFYSAVGLVSLLFFCLYHVTTSYCPGSLLLRRFVVFRVSAGVFLSYKIAQIRTKRIKDEDERDWMWDRVHEKNAIRIYKALVDLEGLWVKAGQYMSTRADVMPSNYIYHLKQLQDTLPPRPFEQVQQIVEEEFGRPMSEMFDYFDKAPLATASIAQVHKAWLAVGSKSTTVVVKVQHKGVKERVMQDLANLRTIMALLAYFEPDFDFQPIVNEWCSEVPKELDFCCEAENTKRVAANLKKGEMAATVDVALPTVLQARRRVIIMSFMEGLRLNDVEALANAGVDFQDVVEAVTRAYAHQIFVDGFFNADPHPGNFLVCPGEPCASPAEPTRGTPNGALPRSTSSGIVAQKTKATVVLLDFGLTKQLEPNVQKALAKMLLAAAEMDLGALLSSFVEMGLVLNVDMPEESMEVVRFFFRGTAMDASQRAAMKSRRKKFKEMRERSLQRNPVDAFPGSIVFFMRVLNLLRGLTTHLGGSVNYLEVMRPYAEATLLSPSMSLTPGVSAPLLIWDSPSRGALEDSLRRRLQELALIKPALFMGLQVCVYKDGHQLVDTAVGTLGKYDPRPVAPDSLINIFSVSKGVLSGMAHMLVDQGLMTYDTPVCKVWPAFGAHGKEDITLAHVLSHTSGLASVGMAELATNPFLSCDWNGMLRLMEQARPAHAPGAEMHYHAMTFGWLVGGIIEAVRRQPLQQALVEMIAEPLGIVGEAFFGVPPGVEARLGTLALDEAAYSSASEIGWRTASQRAQSQELHRMFPTPVADDEEDSRDGSSTTSSVGAFSDAVADRSVREASSKGGEHTPLLAHAEGKHPDVSTPRHAPPSSPVNPVAMLLAFNNLLLRRACIPAANGHFTARALARYYAMIVEGGRVPPRPMPVDAPACLGSRDGSPSGPVQLFRSGMEILDAMRATGPFAHLAPQDSKFGLGFRRYPSASAKEEVDVAPSAAQGQEKNTLSGAGTRMDAAGASAALGDKSSAGSSTHRRSASGSNSVTRARPEFSGQTSSVAQAPAAPCVGYAFGHGGVGGSLTYCDPKHRMAVAVVVNLLSGDRRIASEVLLHVGHELGVSISLHDGPMQQASVAPDQPSFDRLGQS